MKPAKYTFLLCTIVALFYVSAFAGFQIGEQPFLISKPNPVLTGIKQLSIVVLPPTEEPNKNALVWQNIKKEVEAGLTQAGFELISQQASGIDVPELRIRIDTIPLTDSNQCVFHLHTSLARHVYLAKSSLWSVKSDVWDVKPEMALTSIEQLSRALTVSILQQLEAFVQACLAANQPPSLPQDVNDNLSLAEHKPPPKTNKPATAIAQNGTPYIASKNSKVFHKPDCSSASHIKPENIVTYKSLDEAVNAGKRPCKLCKP